MKWKRSEWPIITDLPGSRCWEMTTHARDLWEKSHKSHNRLCRLKRWGPLESGTVRLWNRPTLSEGEKEGRKIEWKHFKMQWNVKETLARPSGILQENHHQRSHMSFQNGPVLSLPYSVICWEHPMGNGASTPTTVMGFSVQNLGS